MMKMNEFQEQLKRLINVHSIENVCDMPDFLLAETLVNSIRAIGSSRKPNLAWHRPGENDNEPKHVNSLA